MGRLAILIAAFAAAFSVSAAAMAQETSPPLLHPMFQDHAVLQRGAPIQVWGAAAPRARVSVTLGDTTRTVAANANGQWRASLPTRMAGGPYTLTARSGAATQTISDVMIGDVYLCSGQSNMEFQTRYATNAYTVINEASNPNIRLFNVTRMIGETPQRGFAAADHWSAATPESVADFSAICYFFGRNLQRAKDIPIGLIASSWGGTVIEAWMSMDALRRLGGFEQQLALIERNATDPAAARAEFTSVMQRWWNANDPGDRGGWYAPAFDDSAWGAIPASGFWEDSGIRELAGFDGIAWYRTEFTLTAAQAAQGGQFVLGPANNIDITYLNGVVVGGVSGPDQPRNYDVAPGALHEGRNVLAVGVLDTGGGGGLWGPANEKMLRLADGSTVPLSNAWRYHISATLLEVTSPPQAPWDGPNAYSVLYNGMIAPIAPYGLSGVLWHQGESNAGAPAAYARLLPGMMEDWRRAFAKPDLPFLIVQLANYGPPVISEPQRRTWGEIRDVQRRVVDADEHAGLAVSIDIGDRFDIHPTQKLIVADRLARIARGLIYGDAIVTSGPAPLTATRAGALVFVAFEHGPLRAYSSNRPMSFELCDAERACRFVDARIEGPSVQLSDARPGDAFVRYCWGDGPICNLYNDEDLPAVPFELAIQ
jgi:sialate O-acetylesterase